MSERPTPETDAAVTTFTSISKLKKRFECSTGKVSADFARRLERERDEALEERDIARLEFEEISNERYEEIQKVLKERDEALSQIYQAEDRAERFCQERDEAREVLREIAEASGFDNIGNWARNKALEALKTK